ncbi:MAG: radical SAM protein [Candidatus Omnitrophica bacterium]|nr:radical SAM protein [Candidatus Omnitrophota bacterium]MDD5609969.1 radical SAM protein [Candidatus Omnitrophota bacterium]
MVENRTRVLIIRPVDNVVFKTNHIRDIRVPFLLKYIEAILLKEEKFDVHLLDCMVKRMDIQGLLAFSKDYLPNVIILCPSTTEYRISLEYAKIIKNSTNAVIIAIGQDATASPQRYIYEDSPIDFVLRGESELSAIKLLERIAANSTDFTGIEGIYMRGYIHPDIAYVKDHHALPFPVYKDSEFNKYTIYYPLPVVKKIIWGHVLSSRGCPYNCIFCSQTIRESYGKELRARDPKDVVDEIEYLREKGANMISFADDNFTTSKEHVINICKEIKRRGLKIIWSAHARIDNCDEYLLNTMKDAGCILLRFGVESGSEKVIKALKKTDIHNWIDKAETVFGAARKINLSTVALFLIGSPLEEEKDVRESIAFAKKINPDLLQICFFTPYPGSKAYEMFKEEINFSHIQDMYHYRIAPLNFSNIPTDRLAGLYRDFYRQFYLRKSYVVRHFLNYSMFYALNNSVFLKLFNMTKLLRN